LTAVLQEAHRVHSIRNGASKDGNVVEDKGRLCRVPRSDLGVQERVSNAKNKRGKGRKRETYELPKDVEGDGGGESTDEVEHSLCYCCCYAHPCLVTLSGRRRTRRGRRELSGARAERDRLSKERTTVAFHLLSLARLPDTSHRLFTARQRPTSTPESTDQMVTRVRLFFSSHCPLFARNPTPLLVTAALNPLLALRDSGDLVLSLLLLLHHLRADLVLRLDDLVRRGGGDLASFLLRLGDGVGDLRGNGVGGRGGGGGGLLHRCGSGGSGSGGGRGGGEGGREGERRSLWKGSSVRGGGADRRSDASESTVVSLSENRKTHLSLASNTETGDSGRVEDALAVRVALSDTETESEEYGPRPACGRKKERRKRRKERRTSQSSSRLLASAPWNEVGAAGRKGTLRTAEEDGRSDDTDGKASSRLDNAVRKAEVGLLAVVGVRRDRKSPMRALRGR